MHPSTGNDLASAASLLPLEFTPFEYYYYLDDGPSYPTTFPVELHFIGELDRQRFERALTEAIQRHPLLHARVDDSGRLPRWVSAASEAPCLDWGPGGAPLAYPAGGALDLRKQTGLRTWVRSGSESARVVFEFHHACCDGLAGLQFVQDFLGLYRAASGGEPASLRLLEPNVLRQRGAIASDGSRAPSIWGGVRDAWYTLKVWAAILFRAPRVLAAPPRTPNSSKREPLAFDIETLSLEESSDLRQAAKRQRTTTNDLLLRDMLLVLRSWNLEHRGPAKGRLRINVPVSVRTRAEAAMPAANRIGYGFVTATMAEANDPEQLLDVVQAETARIKNWKLALYFLGGVAFARNIPGLLPWAMRRRRSFATAVLSNVGRYVADPTSSKLGDPWTCGDLTLEWIGGVPPVRPLTRAAVIVIDYAGRTSLCLRTDPHYFDAAASKKLLDQFAAQVRRTLSSTSD